MIFSVKPIRINVDSWKYIYEIIKIEYQQISNNNQGKKHKKKKSVSDNMSNIIDFKIYKTLHQSNKEQNNNKKFIKQLMHNLKKHKKD